MIYRLVPSFRTGKTRIGIANRLLRTRCQIPTSMMDKAAHVYPKSGYNVILWPRMQRAANDHCKRPSALFNEFGRFAVGPRIVGSTKVDAVRHGRMVEKKKDVDGIGMGVDKDFLAKFLEGNSAILTWVRDDPVRHFEAVNIGLVFLITTEG